MSQLICRPFITLRNGRKLWAWEKGLKAFCFTVEEERTKKETTPSIQEEVVSEE